MCLVEPVTEFKMAASNIFNTLYEQVRNLGVPYEIKESEGAVVIKLSTNKKYSCNQQSAKFRFNTKKTINGSSTPNWRSPRHQFIEHSSSSVDQSKGFPDFHFFQTTPPPQISCLPPPTTATPQSMSTPSKLCSLQIASSVSTTTLNPYRFLKRQITFPRTPNLLTPLDSQVFSFESLSNSASQASLPSEPRTPNLLTPSDSKVSSLETSNSACQATLPSKSVSSEPRPPVSTTLPEGKPPEDFEESKRVMTAIYNRSNVKY